MGQNVNAIIYKKWKVNVRTPIGWGVSLHCIQQNARPNETAHCKRGQARILPS